MATTTSTRRRWQRDRPLSSGEAEEAILSTMDDMEAAAEEYERRALDAAAAETAYRVARAKETLMCALKTDAQREAHAIHRHADLLGERNRTEALRDAQAEVCRVRRSEIEALRTICVNARTAESGRG